MLRKNSIRKDLSLVLIGVALWRVTLFLLSYSASNFLVYAPTFPYFDNILPSTQQPQWLYSWANFDGVHYLTIINEGYIGTGLIQAFFPVYPWLVRIMSAHMFSPLIVGLAVNFIFFTFSLLLLNHLLTLDEVKIKRSTLFLTILLFPTSFFFGAFYTESLFFLLILASLLAARKRMWWLAGLLAAIASATRVIGIVLLPTLIVELLLQSMQTERLRQFKFKLTIALSTFLHFAQDDRRFLSFRLKQSVLETSVIALAETLHKIIKTLLDQKKQLFFISLGMLGLVSYMLFLYREFDDPLYFFSVQHKFGAQRSTHLVFYIQVVWRYVQILVTINPWSWLYYSIIQEFIFGVGGLIVILYSFFKTRASYATFSLFAFILPTLTGTFSSMPRYALVSFSIFIVIAQLLDEKPKLKWIYYPFSLGLLILNTVLFIQGYWVG